VVVGADPQGARYGVVGPKGELGTEVIVTQSASKATICLGFERNAEEEARFREAQAPATP
jgi:hypothetical protein